MPATDMDHPPHRPSFVHDDDDDDDDLDLGFFLHMYLYDNIFEIEYSIT